MSTTFQKADDDVVERLGRVMRQYHPQLATAGVQVGVVMALNPEGPAVTHGGYAALAKVKVVTLKDRVSKGYDAELLIDEGEWNQLREEHRASLLDHELSHLELVPLSPKEAKQVQRDDPHAPTWKLDDLGRPKLRSVPGEWNAGDGFSQVVARHGPFAIEYLNIENAKTRADAARRAGEEAA